MDTSTNTPDPTDEQTWRPARQHLRRTLRDRRLRLPRPHFTTATCWRVVVNGKLANIVGEMNDPSIESLALFKQIVGKDSIMAEHKNKPLFEFTPFCKMIFSANRPPMTRDQSNAFFERWLIIPFETVYDIQPHGGGRVADTQLSSKLWHPAELSGLANRAVAGLQR
jgi:putative DNA primase/helicase